MASTWGASTWSSNSWGDDNNIVSVTGIGATASIGNESIVVDVNPIPTGIGMTSSVGTPTEIITVDVFPSGISSTANLGIADAGPDAMLQGINFSANVGTLEAYNQEGWGRYFYGQFVWGASGDWAFAEPTGIAMSANLGDETITADANLTLTGYAITATEGTVDPSPDATVTGIGFGMAVATGTVISGTADIDVTGIAMTATLGQETIDLNTPVDVTGIAMTAVLSEESVTGDATAQCTGIALTMSLNSVNALIWNNVNTGSAPIDPPGWQEVPTRAA